MAGDWIKMRTNLRSDPRVVAVCSATGAHKTHVVGALHYVWSLADEHSTNGTLWGYSAAQIDSDVGIPGFSEALCNLRDKNGKPRPWLEIGDGCVSIPRFSDHNGESAKKRAQGAQRASRFRNAKRVTKRAPREEKTRGDERREEKISKIDRNEGNQDSCQSPPIVASSLEKVSPGRGEKFEPVGVDWDAVRRLAESVAKVVPPYSEEDRRQWFQYSVIALCHLSEHWLLDAAAAAAGSQERKGTKQAFFVGVLIKTGTELGVDVDGLRKAMKIPIAVWKSDSIQVKK